jgi:hypothetical protein
MLGVLVLVSIYLLSLVFRGGESIQFAFGYTSGMLLTSVALGLPIYIVIRYATKRGKLLGTHRAANLFCFLVAGVWVFQIVLGLVVPFGISHLARPNTTSTPPVIQQKGPKPWERDWSAPNPEQQAGSASKRNYFDQFDSPGQKGSPSQSAR